MRKRVLPVLLSMTLLVSSFTPAFGAEFSSGDEIQAASEADNETGGEEVFSDESSGEEAEAVFGEPEEVFEAGSDDAAEAEPLSPTVSMDTAEEIKADVLYSGTTVQTGNEEEGNVEYLQWYKFTAGEDGNHLLSCIMVDADDFAYVYIGTKEAYSTDEAKYFITPGDPSYNITLQEGTEYYICIKSEFIDKFSLIMKSPAKVLADAQEIVEGESYNKTHDSSYSGWYKFIPEKTGEYVISTVDADFDVYSGSELNEPLTPNDSEKFELSKDETYYIKIGAYMDDEYKLSVKRELTDRDYIEEILNTQGALPRLAEAENDKAVTPAALYEKYGNQKTFMQFVPENTGRYNIKLYRKDDSYQNSVGDLLVYDSAFEKVQEPISLTKDCVYYITNAYAVTDLSDCVFMTEYVPSITSIKVLEEPEDKVLYNHFHINYGYIMLKGIKLEITYDNGKTEILSTDNGIRPKTAYGEYLTGKLDGDKKLDELSAGTYTYTLYPVNDESKSVTIDNIVVKDKEDMPLYTRSGSYSVNTTWDGSGTIRFQPQTTGKYTITSSSKGNISVRDDTPEPLHWGNASTAEITLEAGNWYYISSGAQSEEFTWADKVTITVRAAEKTNLSKCQITAASSAAYTGKALTPAVTVKNGTTTLKKGTDYTVAYTNNKNLGTGTITITGKGDYTGKVTKTFKIVLGTPTISVSSSGYNAVTVKWKAVPGAKSYRLYYKGGSIKSWKLVESGITETSYRHVSGTKFPLVTGTTYTYTVRAVRGSNLSFYKTKTVKPVPAAPKLGKVTSAAYNQHKITWSKVAGATGYVVYQKINKKWVRIKTTKATSCINTHSKDHPVLTGTATTYTVRAYRTVGKTNVFSGYSTTGITGKALLTKPVISKAASATNGIKLQWKASSGANGYVIQRYESGKWVTKGTITSGKTLTYTDKTAKKGQTYRYRIAAYRTVNKKKVLSLYSAVKSVKR